MNNFWNLVSFEYKKILSKRSVQITLFLAILFTAIGVVGTLLGAYTDSDETNYSSMVKDRAYAYSLTGRQLDGELIIEAAKAYAKIPEAGQYQATEEYQQYARPYSAIYGISRKIFDLDKMEDFQVLTEENAEQFYTIRRKQQEQLVNATNMSEKAKEQVLDLDAQIKVPITFTYTDGYSRFFVLANSFGLMEAFVMAICVASLFSGEYTSGADQLILSSKHGKNRVIAAKLFTGYSLAAAICLVLTALSYGLSMGAFGADGGDAPLQLYSILSPYPVTMVKTALILAVCTFFACLMTASVTMLLSARLKSPFGVIILVGLLLFVPMLFNVPETNLILYRLYHLFPTIMSAYWSAMDGIQYELFGLVIKPYLFLPCFAVAVSVFFTPFTYHFFKRHQIG